MRKIPSFKILFGITDLLILFASFISAAFILRKENKLNLFEFISNDPSILIICFLLALVFLIVFQYNGLYKINVVITRAAHLANILKALYYGSLNVVLVSLIIENSTALDSRFLIVLFILIVVPALYIFRVEALRFIFITFSNTSFKRNILIIGNGKAGNLLAAKLIYENPIGLNIVGFVEDNQSNSDLVANENVLGSVSEMQEIINKHDIDEIIVNVDGGNTEGTLKLIDDCKSLNLSVKVTSELFDIVARKMKTEKYIDVPVIDVSSHYNNTVTLRMKRAFDLALSFFALLILFPLMLLIALFIKISSPGPIFFAQTRIGKYGKEFIFYKFRSMKVVKGEDEERVMQMINFMNDENLKTKIINDNRVTWIGKIIRMTSLDELPQLLNVIKGEMSLVGPRPCLPYEYENYSEWQKRRVNVTPGCTGVWQVWGRSSVSFKDSVVLDLYYINNMSPWFDLQLIFQTVPAILTARGAK
ncbi:MAG: sugar transferase [Ignavibacteriaceae bacterium]|nr:sugar transferase [Chlorobium sp.]MCW8996575.1 sugar transferase [Psychromonas sp.]MCW9094293.1 sugar transferase [Ignavibacteriaceae bacterium]MCW9096988.1 sugar transferase [Ignavibacteriaceae bacterium]